jgi:hypothetical protein
MGKDIDTLPVFGWPRRYALVHTWNPELQVLLQETRVS